MLLYRKTTLLIIFSFLLITVKAQLNVQPATTAQALAQRLVGEGVTISNITFTGTLDMAGSFNAAANVGLGIDSGIVITNGRAATTRFDIGVNNGGSGFADDILADNAWSLPGDADLANAIGFPAAQLNDAAVLEFDFVPLGDSIRFNYVFSSEEYTPQYACPSVGGSFNDAFAFFISGPGFPTAQNIALVPNTTTPVSIFNINNVTDGSGNPLCPNNPSYFVNNVSGVFFTHDGHTRVLTALARVQPCQTYHLKLVISDVGDDAFDSGVFLEAKSLSSNATQLENLTQKDPVSGNSYLVEGCITGALNIKRTVRDNFPLVINLSYGGTVQNGIDVQTLPTSITIPANEDSVLLNIIPLIDGLSEGIETLKIYTLAGCAAGLPTDSTEIQIRDYDILGITPDTLIACRNTPIQLQASAGYATYVWDANAALSSTSISNPTVALASGSATFICTATLGTCNAKDSAFVQIKDISLGSKQDVNCLNASTGNIVMSTGPGWVAPIEFSIDGGINYQTANTFNNLPVGNYNVMVKDGSGCIDSLKVPIIQAYPDLLETHTTTQASCSGNADGTITINATGGNPNYQYALNGGSFGNNNVFNVTQGTYTVVVKDDNGCTVNSGNINVTLDNNLTVEAGSDEIICEGNSVQLNAVANLASGYQWSPAVAINNASIANPSVSPVIETKYIVTATSGVCTNKDSVIVRVNAAPIPNAGADITICFGANAVLHASGALEYSWSPSTYLSSTTLAQPTVQRPLTTTSYFLEVKDANGCLSLKKDTVDVIVTPAVQLFAGNDSLYVAINQPVQLNVVQIGAQTVTQYAWTPSYGLSSTTIKNPVATLDRDMTYYVTGTTAANCEGSDTINIKVYKGPEIYVPTAFTPNGDGRNDILKAIAVGMKEYRYFRVYNRYGQVVFEAKNNFDRGWDGRIKGAIQGTGTYVWMAEAVDYRGNVIRRKGTTMILQ